MFAVLWPWAVVGLHPWHDVIAKPQAGVQQVSVRVSYLHSPPHHALSDRSKGKRR